MIVRHLAAGLITLTFLATSQCAVLAGNNILPGTAGTAANSILCGSFQGWNNDTLDPLTRQLLWQLAHKPELMNVEYLSYYLGPSESQISQVGVHGRAYYWYDRLRRPLCQLYQEESQPGEIVQAQMVFNLAPGRLNFDLLKKTLGAPVRTFFDQSAFPTQMYCFVPYTTLCMATPPNTYAVTKATVTYLGPPLAGPNCADLQTARDSFIAGTTGPRVVNGVPDWRETLVLARRRMQESPADARSHVCLAEALKKTGNVQEAIGEYKLSLYLNKYDESVRQQAIQGLRDLYVLPNTGRGTLDGSPSGGPSTGAQLAGNGRQKSN